MSDASRSLVLRSRVSGTSIACALLVALAGCAAPDPTAGSAGEDELPLESLAPDALHWVTPLATDAVSAGDPVDLTVYTQRTDVQVVHFAVDGEEVGACDASDPEQDCFDGDNWSWSIAFDTAGAHTIRASFVAPTGETVQIDRDVTVLPEDSSDGSGDPSGDPAAPDALSDGAQIDEGSGQVTQGIVSARGYLDPNEPVGPASCHARGGNTCNPASEAGCLSWSVQSSRVVLPPPARLDGSTAEVDRCYQDFGASIRHYADLRYVSRAAVTAWLATTGNCGPRHRWLGNLISGARCAAVSRHVTGQHALGAHDCAALAHDNADFAIEVAAEYLARTRRSHHHDPVLMAAYIHHGAHRQRGANNHWCAGSGRSSDAFISQFVAAYNAFRTYENEDQPGTMAAAARQTHVRVGMLDNLSCDPMPTDPTLAARCAISRTQVTRRPATWFWPACVPAWMTPAQLAAAYGGSAPAGLEACASSPQSACPAGHPACGRSFLPDVSPATRLGQNVINVLRTVHADHQRIEVNTLLYAHIPPPVLWAFEHRAALGEPDGVQLLEDASDAYLYAILHYAPAVDPAAPAGQGVNAPLGSNPLIDTWGIVNETVGRTHYQMRDGTDLYLGGTGEWESYRDAAGARVTVLGSHYADYLLHVFETAHRYAPDAQLMINELNGTGGSASHMDRYRALVHWLLAHGAALDVVGLQAHDDVSPGGDADPSYATLADNLARFASVADDAHGQLLRGLEPGVREHRGPRIHYTETDVRTGAADASRDEDQRAHFYNIVSACVHEARCSDVTFWGVGDQDSWADCLGQSPGHAPDHAMLYDARYCPRTSVPTVIDALRGAELPSEDTARTALSPCASMAPAPDCACFPGTGGGTPQCCGGGAHPVAANVCM